MRACNTLLLVSATNAYLTKPRARTFELLGKHLYSPESTSVQQHATPSRAPAIASLAVASLVTAAPAFAADALPSATAAYAHYLALMGIVGALTTERLLLKEDMDEASFDLLARADIAYGLSGLLVLVSGYFRATAYGKGWEFYAHEPLFWVKMALLAIVGSASYFPTIKIVQRAVAKTKAKGDVPPLSPALVQRMTSIVNAELLGVLSIPFVATFTAVWKPTSHPPRHRADTATGAKSRR